MRARTHRDSGTRRPREINAGSGHERGEACDKVLGTEQDVRGAVADWKTGSAGATADR